MVARVWRKCQHKPISLSDFSIVKISDFNIFSLAFDWRSSVRLPGHIFLRAQDGWVTSFTLPVSRLSIDRLIAWGVGVSSRCWTFGTFVQRRIGPWRPDASAPRSDSLNSTRLLTRSNGASRRPTSPPPYRKRSWPAALPACWATAASSLKAELRSRCKILLSQPTQGTGTQILGTILGKWPWRRRRRGTALSPSRPRWRPTPRRSLLRTSTCS